MTLALQMPLLDSIGGPRPNAASDEWFTPKAILDALPPIWLDPCYNSASNVRAQRTYDLRKGQDALLAEWHLNVPPVLPPPREADTTANDWIVFVNPPYSDCARWCEHVELQAQHLPIPTVMLIPALPGESYWHRHIWPHMDGVNGWCAFLNGRQKFDTVAGRSKGGGTFGSALVCIGGRRGTEHRTRAVLARLRSSGLPVVVVTTAMGW